MQAPLSAAPGSADDRRHFPELPGLVLFISRKYPPAIGGMERLSYQIATGIAARTPVEAITWGGSRIWLPLFLPYALLRALWVLATRPVVLIHLGDLVLAPLGLLLRAVSGRPVTASAHGLDILYPNRFYQLLVPASTRRLDRVVCNSEHTRQACLAHGVDAGRTLVIAPAVDARLFDGELPAGARAHWLERWGLPSEMPHLLLSAGRMVPRKGHRFLVDEVLPGLAERRSDWACLMVGGGPERAAVQAAIEAHALSAQVRLLGRVPDAELAAAYALADAFVMCNLSIPGNSEGFGMVHLEARAAGLPVVADEVDGIADALSSPEDGILVPAGQASAWVEALDRMLDRPPAAEERRARRERVLAHYGCSQLADRYLAVFRGVLAGDVRLGERGAAR